MKAAIHLLVFLSIAAVVVEGHDLEALKEKRKELEKKLKKVRSASKDPPTRNAGWPIITSTRAASDYPRIHILDNFLTEEECEYIIELSKSHVKNAGQGQKSPSFNHDTKRLGVAADTDRQWEQNDPIMRNVISRIHEHLFVPVEFGEPVNVEHYKKNNYHELHTDSNVQKGRMITFSVFLNDVKPGGEMVFPGVNRDKKSSLPTINWGTSDHPEMSPFCNDKSTFKVAPKRGRAVLLFNHNPDITDDKYSLYGSCPVKKGEKWVLQRWIRFYTDKEGNQFFNTFAKP